MRTFYFIALGAGLLLACKPSAPKTQSITSELHQYFDNTFPSDEPGCAILVSVRDTILFSKGYGLADLHTKEAINTATLFNVGSLTKTFVSSAILQLSAHGKLSLDDSLWKYFPNFKHPHLAQKVKLKHLLTHTSGLPDIRHVGADTVFYLTAKDAENWSPITQTDSLLFEPGSQFEYSNPSFNGLALIIEQVSGMPWQQYVAKYIFEPAGMKKSTITNGPYPDQGVSHAYVKNHSQWTEDDYGEEPTFPAAGNGGVWSSVEELALYENAIQNAIFLPAAQTADSRTIKHFDNWKGTRPYEDEWSWFQPAKNSDGNLSPFIGWSWFIGETAGGLKIVGHTGSQGGFLCNYVSIPEKKIFFVILCNTPRSINAYSDKIMEVLGL